MKNCYANPKLTERESFNVGSCYSNSKLLEYQKDMQFVKRLMSDREKQAEKMIKHAVYAVLGWGILMLIIWFFLLPKV